MFAENLDIFVGDFGVTVYYGSQTALAIFDQPDALVLSQREISREYLITYQASKLVGLSFDDTVYIGKAPDGWTWDSSTVSFDSDIPTMDGSTAQAYTVLEVTSLEDGAFYSAKLEKQ